jgi:glucokinase
MAEALVLAVDVGGTKTDIALFRAGPRLQMVRERRVRSADQGGLEAVVGEFLGGEEVRVAACAAAGPVVEDCIQTTNLPWTISAASLSAMLGGARVVLLNDLEAAATGILDLPAELLRPLKKGVGIDANRAVLSPGTGLGQAILFWDGARHRPVASEGGHVGFAPRDEEQIELLRYLRRRHEQVSYEHILSGPGLVDVFGFVTEVLGIGAAEGVRSGLAAGRQAAAIGSAATSGECAASRRSVELFARVLAARAGDLALSVLARGGIYLGGGMVPKLLPVIAAAGFEECFVGRGPFRDLLSEIPVQAVLEERVALFGAAVAANREVGDAAS